MISVLVEPVRSRGTATLAAVTDPSAICADPTALDARSELVTAPVARSPVVTQPLQLRFVAAPPLVLLAA
jgi:hypothetical protein